LLFASYFKDLQSDKCLLYIAFFFLSCMVYTKGISIWWSHFLDIHYFFLAYFNYNLLWLGEIIWNVIFAIEILYGIEWIDEGRNADKWNVKLLSVMNSRDHSNKSYEDCITCNQSVRNKITEMKYDPTYLRFKVLTQTVNICVICNSGADVHRITLQCRINVFVLRDIFIPEDVRSTSFRRSRFLSSGIAIWSINIPYVIKGQLLMFL